MVSQAALAALPGVDELRKDAAAAGLEARFGHELTVAALRQSVADEREEILAGLDTPLTAAELTDRLATRARAYLFDWNRPRPAEIVNMSGTVLHTNLGRAPLPPEAIEALTTAAARPTDLEIDITTGKRGQRDRHVVEWLRRLTGAESATVVNNNAAAVLLVLNTLALRKQVPVSRGELVEIGGSFRMPDVMARAGCKLIEVGTTNKTHAADYARAIGKRTALLMKVHTSNYEVKGFTASVPARALCELAHAHELPAFYDLGCGALVDLSRFALPREDTPAQALKDGFDLVAFSGDKLLGGPQCGIIVGRSEFIERIARNPLKRALRVDKLTMAALSATLPLYGNLERLVERLPALRLLTRKPQSMRAQAEALRAALAGRLGEGWSVEVVECESQVGSGSMALASLPSLAVSATPLAPKRKQGRLAAALGSAFRALPLPVLGRVNDGVLLLDLRCVEDESPVLAQLHALNTPDATA